ncbi:MAG TPA: SurA N-terminal domain-containing protein [Pyrinomonadaceae bacterium]|nr:SurA N-terminal domain-containing protein [Pyrinomonadaceae bacterium]
MRNIAKVLTVTCLVAAGLILSGCDSGGSEAKDNQVAATVNGRNIMLKEVERAVTQQAGGNASSLNQLQMAQARLQVLSNLIQREVLFQKAEREKLLPTEAQIDGAIATQKQNSGMTAEDFDKSLKAQNMSMESLREEARKDLAIASLQDKYNGKIDISDREVEEYYANNRTQFVKARGVALSMIMVDPADNAADGIKDDAKGDPDAKLKIDNIYTQLQGKADFATVARAKSEDVNSLRSGGDIGFATEQDLKNNNFPAELVANLFGTMQVGDYTQPTRFASGKWYIFKLAEKQLTTENLTLESAGVRQQITQGLTNQHKQVLNAALLETAINDAKIVNHLATEMLSNPGNLGLRPAAANATTGSQPAQAPAASPAASTTTGPTSASSPVSVKPAASPK